MSENAPNPTQPTQNPNQQTGREALEHELSEIESALGETSLEMVAVDTAGEKKRFQKHGESMENAAQYYARERFEKEAAAVKGLFGLRGGGLKGWVKYQSPFKAMTFNTYYKDSLNRMAESGSIMAGANDAEAREADDGVLERFQTAATAKTLAKEANNIGERTNLSEAADMLIAKEAGEKMVFDGETRENAELRDMVKGSLRDLAYTFTSKDSTEKEQKAALKQWNEEVAGWRKSGKLGGETQVDNFVQIGETIAQLKGHEISREAVDEFFDKRVHLAVGEARTGLRQKEKLDGTTKAVMKFGVGGLIAATTWRGGVNALFGVGGLAVAPIVGGIRGDTRAKQEYVRKDTAETFNLEGEKRNIGEMTSEIRNLLDKNYAEGEELSDKQRIERMADVTAEARALLAVGDEKSQDLFAYKSREEMDYQRAELRIALADVMRMMNGNADFNRVYQEKLGTADENGDYKLGTKMREVIDQVTLKELNFNAERKKKIIKGAIVGAAVGLGMNFLRSGVRVVEAAGREMGFNGGGIEGKFEAFYHGLSNVKNTYRFGDVTKGVGSGIVNDIERMKSGGMMGQTLRKHFGERQASVAEAAGVAQVAEESTEVEAPRADGTMPEAEETGVVERSAAVGKDLRGDREELMGLKAENARAGKQPEVLGAERSAADLAKLERMEERLSGTGAAATYEAANYEPTGSAAEQLVTAGETSGAIPTEGTFMTLDEDGGQALWVNGKQVIGAGEEQGLFFDRTGNLTEESQERLREALERNGLGSFEEVRETLEVPVEERHMDLAAFMNEQREQLSAYEADPTNVEKPLFENIGSRTWRGDENVFMGQPTLQDNEILIPVSDPDNTVDVTQMQMMFTVPGVKDLGASLPVSEDGFVHIRMDADALDLATPEGKTEAMVASMFNVDRESGLVRFAGRHFELGSYDNETGALEIFQTGGSGNGGLAGISTFGNGAHETVSYRIDDLVLKPENTSTVAELSQRGFDVANYNINTDAGITAATGETINVKLGDEEVSLNVFGHRNGLDTAQEPWAIPADREALGVAYGNPNEGATALERAENVIRDWAKSPEELAQVRVGMGLGNEEYFNTHEVIYGDETGLSFYEGSDGVIDTQLELNEYAEYLRTLSAEDYDKVVQQTMSVFYERMDGGTIEELDYTTDPYNYTTYMKQDAEKAEYNPILYFVKKIRKPNGTGTMFLDRNGQNIMDSDEYRKVMGVSTAKNVKFKISFRHQCDNQAVGEVRYPRTKVSTTTQPVTQDTPEPTTTTTTPPPTPGPEPEPGPEPGPEPEPEPDPGPGPTPPPEHETKGANPNTGNDGASMAKTEISEGDATREVVEASDGQSNAPQVSAGDSSNADGNSNTEGTDRSNSELADGFNNRQ